jgi:hypothetical protein
LLDGALVGVHQEDLRGGDPDQKELRIIPVPKHLDPFAQVHTRLHPEMDREEKLLVPGAKDPEKGLLLTKVDDVSVDVLHRVEFQK